MQYPKIAKIVEVGPRDGLQNEKTTVSAAIKADFIDRLSACGFSEIEAGSFVSEKKIPQLSDTKEVLGLIHPNESCRYPVLVPNEVGMQAAIEAGARDIAIFTAASETFCQKNIHCSIEESFQRFESVMTLAKEHDITVRGYISCCFGCPYEGDVDPHKVDILTQRLLKLGCYEVSLGDTIGVATPDKVIALLQRLLKSSSADQLAVHFHDTYGQAIANIFAALQCGIATIDSSVAGLGGCPYAKGASGNVATEDVLYLLHGLGIETGIQLEPLIQAGEFICQQLGRSTQSKVAIAYAARSTP